MASAIFPLSDLVTVSLSATPVLPQTPNQSTILLVTQDNIPSGWSAGQVFAIYTSLGAVGTDFGVDSNTYAIAESAFAQQPNFLGVSGGYLVILPRLQSPSLESIQAAVVRAQGLVSFFGVLCDQEPADIGQTALLALCTYIQSQNLMFFITSSNANDVNSGGLLDLIRQASDENTRYAYYGTALKNGAGAQQTQIFAAAYAARLLSVNFTAAGSTLTMQGKQLSGIGADNTLTDTIVTAAQAAGASVYANFSSYVCLYESGANNWSDQIQNQLWLAMALQTQGFDTIVGQANKLPFTENGMNTLKAALAITMAQSVFNGFIAPGAWPAGSNTFGQQAVFLQNISNIGYYIYSAPVSGLTQAQLQTRTAPAIQIACLSAGAIHKAAIQVTVALG